MSAAGAFNDCLLGIYLGTYHATKARKVPTCYRQVGTKVTRKLATLGAEVSVQLLVQSHISVRQHSPSSQRNKREQKAMQRNERQRIEMACKTKIAHTLLRRRKLVLRQLFPSQLTSQATATLTNSVRIGRKGYARGLCMVQRLGKSNLEADASNGNTAGFLFRLFCNYIKLTGRKSLISMKRASVITKLQADPATVHLSQRPMQHAHGLTHTHHFFATAMKPASIITRHPPMADQMATISCLVSKPWPYIHSHRKSRQPC